MCDDAGGRHALVAFVLDGIRSLAAAHLAKENT